MNNDRLVKNASYASVVAGVLIFSIKIIAWLKSDSAALFASLVDSLLDITSSIINVIAIQIALSPADDNHRFGHNKVQDLAVFAQSVVFVASGAGTLFISIKKFSQGHIVDHYEYSLVAMVICLLIGLILIFYQNYVILRTGSHIINADKTHYIADCATNLAVILSIAGSRYFENLDAIFGILISAYIIYSASRVLRGSIKNLIDEEFSDEDKHKVLQILRNNKDILGVHDLKTRHAGNKAFIQFHVDLDDKLSLIQAHKISEQLTLQLMSVFVNCEVIIHQDPIGCSEKIEHRENL
jgi:cation diffusion facilitator family transporter